jgi:hypothetical protein
MLKIRGGHGTPPQPPSTFVVSSPLSPLRRVPPFAPPGWAPPCLPQRCAPTARAHAWVARSTTAQARAARSMAPSPAPPTMPSPQGGRTIRSPCPSAWCTAGVPSHSPSQRSSFPGCRVLCLCAHDSSTDPLTRSAQPRIPNDDARMKVQIHFLVYTISFAVCFHFSSKHTTICPFDIYMLLRYYLFTDLLTDSGDVAKSYSPRCS